MRTVLSTKGATSGYGASAALSVATHVVLITAGVYATGIRSRDLERAIAERVSYVRYLLPHDRVRATVGVGEVLRYVQQGGGGVELPVRMDGQLLRAAGTSSQEGTGGAFGADARDQTPVKEVLSPDSAYSVLDVEETATRSAGSAAPLYPSDLLREGTEGSVTVRFVVDTIGHADSSSIQVLSFTHPEFAQSVRHALPLMTFTPAAMGGRKVRQIVEQRFGFKLQPADPRPLSATRPVP